MLQSQGARKKFLVKPVPTAADGTDFKAMAEFQQKTSELSRKISSAVRKLGEVNNRLRYMKEALLETPKATPEFFARYNTLEESVTALSRRLTGDPIRQKFNESTVPSIRGRVGEVIYGHWGTRQNPTATQQRNIKIAVSDFEKFKDELVAFYNAFEGYEADLEAVGAPYTAGRKFK